MALLNLKQFLPVMVFLHQKYEDFSCTKVQKNFL